MENRTAEEIKRLTDGERDEMFSSDIRNEKCRNFKGSS